jgi:glycosyltransferase involved in cell wall biosynthesis
MSNGTPLKIVHTEASLGWGGQEIRILTEAAAFVRKGHRVHLVCDPDSDIFSAAPTYGLERIAVPMKKKGLSNLRKIRALLRDLDPDIVNAHSSIDHWLTAAARVTLGRKPKIVRTRHIDVAVSRSASSRWLYNKGCEFVMATSRAMVRDLTHDGFLTQSRVAAIPTGIDVAAFSAGDRTKARIELGLPVQAYLFGITATLRAAKGHTHLLEAMAAIDAAVARLVIIGDGPQEDNLRKMIDRLGIGARVVMAGRQRNVADWLAALDAFVLPTYAEGVPQALIQAMACRLPVIASRVGGIPEVVDGLEAATLIEPRSTDALLEAMRRRLASRPGEAELDAMRQRVEERYSLDSMQQRVEAVFRKVAG